MRVVLRDDVDGVGRRGDIVTVAGGFARNFLLPEGRAIMATDGIELQAQAMRRGARHALGEGPRGGAGAGGRARPGGHHGVGAGRARPDASSDRSGPRRSSRPWRQHRRIEIDRHAVQLDEPIKELGSVAVTVRLYEDVTATLQVEVVAATLRPPADAPLSQPCAQHGPMPFRRVTASRSSVRPCVAPSPRSAGWSRGCPQRLFTGSTRGFPE